MNRGWHITSEEGTIWHTTAGTRRFWATLMGMVIPLPVQNICNFAKPWLLLAPLGLTNLMRLQGSSPTLLGTSMSELYEPETCPEEEPNCNPAPLVHLGGQAA